MLARTLKCRQTRASAAMMPAYRGRHTAVRIVAFKESDNTVHDWRTQKMIQTAHDYYASVWNRGDIQAARKVIDEQVVLRDNIWAPPDHLVIVGLNAFTTYLQDQRQCYPDMCFDIEQMGVQDATHLFVLWTCHGTQLESKQGPASYHSSVFSGIDILGFNSDRDKVVEVSQYRQPSADERHKLAGKQETSSPFEIKLARLHWEPNEHGSSASSSNGKGTATDMSQQPRANNSSNGKGGAAKRQQ